MERERSMSPIPEEEDRDAGNDLKGTLMRRKDFLDTDESAKSHPNRLYYFKRNKDFDEIIEACSRKLQSDPTNLRVIYLRGNALMKKGQSQEAIADLSFVLKHQPHNIDALYSRGLAYSKQGSNEDAIADLTSVLNLNPDHVNAAFARAACYNKLNDLARAIEDYNFALFKDQALSSSPMRDEFSGNRGRTSSTGSASTTFMLDSPYNKSIMSTVNNINASDAFSPSHSIGGETNQSRPGSKRFDIDAAGIFSLYGVSSPTLTNHKSSNTFDGGGDALSPIRPASAMSLTSKSSTVTFKSLADYRTISGRMTNTSIINLDDKPKKSALKTSSSSSNLSLNSTANNHINDQNNSTAIADQHHAAAYELRRQGNYPAAVMEYTLALQADPRHFKSLFNRGFAYDKLGEYEAAIKDYSTAIDVNPDYAFCYYNRGITYDHMNDLHQALRDFSKAIELLPENVDFYHNRAYCLRKMDRLEEAIRDYSMILTTQPNNFKALYNRSLCYDRLGNMLLEAMSDINLALQIQSTHVGCLLHRAMLYEKSDCFDKALLDYSLVLQLSLQQGGGEKSINLTAMLQALTARAKLFARMTRHEDAIRDFSSALEHSPKDLELLLGRALNYKALGNYSQAIEDLTMVLSMDKESVVAYSHRGYCHRKLEQLDLAIVDYSEVIRLFPNNIRALNHRGYLYARLNRFQEAIDDYTAAIALDGNNGYAYHNRGIAYDKIGLIDQAIADFGRAFELEAKLTVRSPAPFADGTGTRPMMNAGGGNNTNGLTLRQQAQLRSRSNSNNNFLQQSSSSAVPLLNSAGSVDNTDNNSNGNNSSSQNLPPQPRSIASSTSGNNNNVVTMGSGGKGYFSSSLICNDSNMSSPLTSPKIINHKGMTRPRIGLEYSTSQQQQILSVQPMTTITNTSGGSVGSDLDDRLDQMASQLTRFDSSFSHSRPSSYPPGAIQTTGIAIDRNNNNRMSRPVIGITAASAPATVTWQNSATRPSFFRDPVPVAVASSSSGAVEAMSSFSPRGESLDRSESGTTVGASGGGPINAAAYLAKLKETQDHQQSSSAIQHFLKHPQLVNNAVVQGKFSSPQIYSSSVAGGNSAK